MILNVKKETPERKRFLQTGEKTRRREKKGKSLRSSLVIDQLGQMKKKGKPTLMITTLIQVNEETRLGKEAFRSSS